MDAASRPFYAVGSLEYADKLLADAADALTFAVSNLDEAEDALDVAPFALTLRLLAAHTTALQMRVLEVIGRTDKESVEPVVPMPVRTASRN